MKVAKYSLVMTLGLLILTFPVALRADTYTYSYTGNPLTSCSGPGCVSTAPYPVITGSFTLNSPLGANMAYGTVTPVSWQISDGISTLTSLNSTLETPLEIETVGGVITEWNFFAQQFTASTYSEMYTSNIPPSTPSYCCPEDATLDQGTLSGPFTALANNANEFDAGTWTASVTVPEPSTSLLMVTGLLGLLALVPLIKCQAPPSHSD